MTREEIAKQIGEDALFVDGLDEALIGYALRCGTEVALYDAERCIEILITEQGLSEEDAREHFSYDILQSYAGEMTPMFAYLSQNKGESL